MPKLLITVQTQQVTPKSVAWFNVTYNREKDATYEMGNITAAIKSSTPYNYHQSLLI